MNRITKLFISIILVFVLLTISGLVFLYKNPLVRLNVVRSPIIQFLLPTFRSLRKIVDLPYMGYQFRKSTLPVYDIDIDLIDIARMNAALPSDFIKGRLTDEYKLKVRANFFANNYEDRIRIRYRGRGPNHWNAFKKSYHADFDVDMPFSQTTELKFFIPEDRGYAVEPLNMYRAKKLGLTAPQPWFTRLRINGEDMGVYYAISHWTPAFTEIAGYGEYANIFGIIDLTLDELSGKNFFDPKEIRFWEDYTRNADTNPEDFVALKDFLTFIHTAPDNIYAKVLPIFVDMDSLYNWLILQTLASSAHQNGVVNIVLLRDPATNRFQPIPWDTQLYSYGPINLSAHPLIGRTLSVPTFKQEFLTRLLAYVQDRTNLEDDLRFYDETASLLRPELFSDTAKLPLNFQVTRTLNENRSTIINNFNVIQAILEDERYDDLFVHSFTTYDPDINYTPPPFAQNTLKPISEFLLKQAYFYAYNETTIGIGPGVVFLPHTTVLPYGYDLQILPGTTLIMGENTSLILFGNINAIGSASKPITIRGQSSREWGTLLAIGNNRSNHRLDYVRMQDGSGIRDYYLNATGMLAIHYGNAHISNSIFSSTHNDDAVNVKRGRINISNNSFTTTFGDAIDLDVTTGNVLSNTFSNIGFDALKREIPNGDGIDISFSKLMIKNNKVDGCGDKGISVGEQTYVIIRDTSVRNCSIGISVKDLSEAVIENVSLHNNKIGIELKQKKPLFGGSTVHLMNSILGDNDTNFEVDLFSELISASQ